MANYATLKAAIAAVIKENGNNEITGNLLRQSLLAMVDSLGVGYQYAGIATPATNPGTPDQNLFYIASTAGTYANFGGLVLADGEIAILKYNGAWSKDSTGAASLEKLNQLGQELSKYTGEYNYNDSVESGVAIYIEHPVTIPANTEFSIKFNDNGALSDGAVLVHFYNADKTQSRYVELNRNVARTLFYNFDIASILIDRSAPAVISSGSIETNIVLAKEKKLTIDDVENIIGNRSFVFSDAIQSGVAFTAKHNIPLRKGDIVLISSPSNGQFSGDEISITGHNNGYDSFVFNIVLDLKEFTKIIIPENADYFTLNRSGSGVISSGTLSVSMSIIGMIDVQIQESVKGNTTIIDLSVSAGIAVNEYIPVEIPAGKTASIVFNANGIFSSNAINFALYDGEKMISNLTAKDVSVPFIVSPQERVTKLYVNRSASGIIGSGTVRVIVSVWGDDNNGVAYMATNGNDANNGTITTPVSSLVRALSISRNVIVRGGEYSGQELDLSAFSGKDIYISSYQGEKPIFTKSLVIANGNDVQYSGNVFSVDCANSPTANWLWQHLVADANTAIGVDEIHPLQKGVYNRLDCTKIQKITDASVASLSDAVTYMENAFASGKYFWYYQTGKLYFTRPTATSNAHPVVMPNGSIIFGENSGNKLHLSGMSFYYGNVSIVNSLKTEIVDCVSKYNHNSGSFHWTGGKNLTFKKCEAAATENGSAGDGFNGDTTQSAPDIVCASVSLIDCWSHDNNDDGYSDHQGCDCVIHGGLYEYNRKAGVTPSYGTHCCCYDVISRKNINGFYYIGNVADYGKSGNALFFNCIARDNENDGFKVDGSKNGVPNTVVCKSCASINNTNYGYEGLIYAYDCGALNNANAKDASVIAINTQTL